MGNRINGTVVVHALDQAQEIPMIMIIITAEAYSYSVQYKFTRLSHKRA